MPNFIAEIHPVHTPLPASARMFVLLEAETLAKAISAANGLGVLRHDKVLQVDIYERHGNVQGPKLYSGLHRVPAVRPQLKVV